MKTMYRSVRSLVLPLVCLTALACESPEKKEPTTVAVATPSASQAAAPAASAAPWYVGKWSTKFTTRVHRIEMEKKEGAVAEWSKDDGTKGVGDVTLDLDVSAAGEAAGQGTGALGKLLATGSVNGDDLRVQLSTPAAEASQAFSGVLLASRSGDVIKGKLQVSTGDSLMVRSAEVTLEKPKGAGAASPVSSTANPSAPNPSDAK